VSPYIPIRMIQEVRATTGKACEFCLLPQSSQEATFHIEHIVPRYEGGETDATNLAPPIGWRRDGEHGMRTQYCRRLLHPWTERPRGTYTA